MTTEELQRIVLIVANQTFVRYWAHFNYPQFPRIMAIQIAEGKKFDDLLESGFKWDANHKMYFIQATT